MSTLTFLGLAEKILDEEKLPLAPSEIWTAALARGYDKMLRSTGKTPAQTLYSSIFQDAKTDNSAFEKVSDRPARYFLKRLKFTPGDSLPVKASVLTEKLSFKEIQLHPFLTHFVSVQFDAHAKTIRHNTSKKDEFGEWVHPDMIAVRYPSWRHAVIELSKKTGEFAAKVFSFEIKRSLSFSNLRESFFQAVSNSSFANEGYLAAANISTDEDFRIELRRLSTSFGIGIIELDIEEPDSSHILVPARERDTLDWDALDKVAMNPDVQSLLERISKEVTVAEVKLEYYDKVLTADELVSSLK